MKQQEVVRLQRILALLNLGILDALEKLAISTEEAERLLYSPGTMEYCEDINSVKELYDAIHCGTELSDIVRLLPGRVDAVIQKMRSNSYLTLEKTDESDSQLAPWLPRLLQ